MRKAAFVAIVALLAAGCGKPVPAEKSAYVGEWHAKQMALLITQDGRVAYKRTEGRISTSADAPLKGFIGNDFVVGVGPIETTFKVSAPPHKDGGTWKMTVDGVELKRIDEW